MRPILIAVLVLTVAGCTAPGEPPAHPSKADYQDLMRRETAKATGTIATMQVVVSELRRGRITQYYATVMTRQSVADLTSVVTDLRQITAPSTDLARHQHQIQRLLTGTIPTVGSVIDNWDQRARLVHTASRLSAAGRRLAKISPELA